MLLVSLVFRYNSEDLWWSIAYFRKGVKIYQSTCRSTPPPPELKKLKLEEFVMVSEIGQLAVVCAWGRWTLTMNTIDSLAFMFSLKIGRQCTPPPRKNKKVGFQVKVTFCFWLMYPPPGMKKLDIRSTWHFGSGWCTLPTQKLKLD